MLMNNNKRIFRIQNDRQLNLPEQQNNVNWKKHGRMQSSNMREYYQLYSARNNTNAFNTGAQSSNKELRLNYSNENLEATTNDNSTNFVQTQAFYNPQTTKRRNNQLRSSHINRSLN